MSRKFTILLSASFPSKARSEKYTKIPFAQVQIEAAVAGLARNVFQSGGRLIFGGHPSISPLVAMVAMEYDLDKEIENVNRNESGDKPVVIYQSRAFEDVMPHQTSLLFNLGFAKIVWTDARAGEKYDPHIKGVPQCPASLTAMRERMTDEHIDALVCMGGMEGVEEEIRLFIQKHPTKPVYVLESTGGASGRLAENFPDLRYIFGDRPVGGDNIKLIERDLPKIESRERDRGDEAKIKIVPYVLLAAKIVGDLLNEDDLLQGPGNTASL